MAWSYKSPTFESKTYNAGEVQFYVRDDTFRLEQTGTSTSGITLKLSRDIYLVRTYQAEDGVFELTCNGTTETVAIQGATYQDWTPTSATTTATITVPSSWAGETVSWSYKYLKDGAYVVQETADRVKFEGSFSFGAYGQFALTITATNSTVTVERTSSPQKGAATGNLSTGAAIYTDDVLRITFQPGYKLTVNDEPFNSGDETTVKSDVVVAVSAITTLDVYADGAWSKYLINIYSDGAWSLYRAEVYSDGSWSKYF